jgi:hypothetical protein
VKKEFSELMLRRLPVKSYVYFKFLRKSECKNFIIKWGVLASRTEQSYELKLKYQSLETGKISSLPRGDIH